LLSRLRHCPKCDGCHHNFVDICPHSGSIDIQQKPFLHCFTCGHVAPEENFLSRGILVCPNCRSTLRHIGADYDRPMENYVCRDCGKSFVEPAVIAHCLTCGAENNPDALVPRQIQALRLAPRGSTAARTGSLEDIYALLDNLNYVRPQHFESLVDWLLAICRRHREERFSLLGIRLRNIETLTDRLGRHRVAELIDGFAVRLRETIRRTDLSTRSSQRSLWLLLPKTDCPACTLLLQRVTEIGEQTRQPEGPQLEFDLVTFNAPDEMMPEESARLLMARLMGTIAE
jgi:GGDEF domain-containing protein